MRVVSQKLRDFAREQECTLRIPGVCNFNPETTVLAHLPCGMKGVGMKSPDNMGVHACSNCHTFIDGDRRWEVSAFDYLRALAETQMRLIEHGLIKITGIK
jgi:acetone carboxylase gamma subunit